MITLICGKRRTGKTSLATARELNENLRFFNERYENAVSYIKMKNKYEGLKLTLPPQRHVVSANFEIHRRYPNMTSYQISGYEFGVPHKKAPELKKLIPYGSYVFDEAQRYFDSKGDNKLPPWVTQCFELSGHIHIDITLIAQRYIRINKDIRDIVDEFIYIEKSLHTIKVDGKNFKSDIILPYGLLVKTEWFGRKFKSEAEIENYLTGKDPKAGEEYYYCFLGDITSHYDRFNYATDFEDDYKNFDYEGEMHDERPCSWDNYKKELKKNEKKD